MARTGLARRFAVLGGLLAVLAALLVAPLASPASAEPDYPPEFCQIRASSFVVPRGGSITFTVESFKPGSDVRYRVVADGGVVQRGHSVPDADGVVVQKLTFDVVGRNTVTFTAPAVAEAGWCNGYEPSTDVTVTGGGNGGGGDGDPAADPGDDSGSLGGLPRTGAQILGALALGGVLLGGGALLVAVTRKRRHA